MPSGKPNVNAVLAASVRDQKIVLYSIDDGAECASELAGVAFVLSTVLTASQAERMRQSQMIVRIKVAYSACVEMMYENKYVLEKASVLSAALDDALKIARLLRPASIAKAARQ